MGIFRRTRPATPEPAEPSPVVEAAARLSQLARDLQRGSAALMQKAEAERRRHPLGDQ